MQPCAAGYIIWAPCETIKMIAVLSVVLEVFHNKAKISTCSQKSVGFASSMAKSYKNYKLHFSIICGNIL